MAGELSQQGFQIRTRGYDRDQVDERLAALDVTLREVRGRLEDADARVMTLSGEVAEAQRQLREVERPSYSGLGARIEQLLRLAEEQASDVVAAATKEAEETLAQTRVEAGQVRAAAQNESADLTATAQRETSELRRNATTEAEEIVATATRTGRGDARRRRPRGGQAEVGDRARDEREAQHRRARARSPAHDRGPRGHRAAGRRPSARSTSCAPPPSARPTSSGRARPRPSRTPARRPTS